VSDFSLLGFFLLGVAGSSFYWVGYRHGNPDIKFIGILFSGIMLMIAILAIAIIKSHEDREKELHEGEKMNKREPA
jgi:multisubunit Na+/H+ antiporter MnhB subunit